MAVRRQGLGRFLPRGVPWWNGLVLVSLLFGLQACPVGGLAWVNHGGGSSESYSRSVPPLVDAADSADVDRVKGILREGGSVDVTDEDGNSALHAAAKGGHDEVVEVLLEAKANKDAVDHEGMTPLHEAAFAGHGAIARLLVAAGAELNMVDQRGRTPLFGCRR